MAGGCWYSPQTASFKFSLPQGDYVSFGKLDPWSGGIFPTTNLINALETRSYKKEIIMTYVNDAPSAFEPAVNFFFSLRSMGYRVQRGRSLAVQSDSRAEYKIWHPRTWPFCKHAILVTVTKISTQHNPSAVESYYSEYSSNGKHF